MEKVYLYWEENYGALLDDCNACSELRVFADKERTKQHIAKTIQMYASDRTDYGLNRFVVDSDVLEYADINLSTDGKITDEQIIKLVETIFKDNDNSITLYADEHENYNEYFTISLAQKEIIY